VVEPARRRRGGLAHLRVVALEPEDHGVHGPRVAQRAGRPHQPGAGPPGFEGTQHAVDRGRPDPAHDHLAAIRLALASGAAELVDHPRRDGLARRLAARVGSEQALERVAVQLVRPRPVAGQQPAHEQGGGALGSAVGQDADGAVGDLGVAGPPGHALDQPVDHVRGAHVDPGDRVEGGQPHGRGPVLQRADQMPAHGLRVELRDGLYGLYPHVHALVPLAPVLVHEHVLVAERVEQRIDLPAARELGHVGRSTPEKRHQSSLIGAPVPVGRPPQPQLQHEQRPEPLRVVAPAGQVVVHQPAHVRLPEPAPPRRPRAQQDVADEVA
jgi:hypothetical protein